MAKRDIVVVGASAGGIEALEKLLSNIPADFPGTVFIVLHVAAQGTNMLASILDRPSRLPVSTARDTSAFESGHVYVAPADYHLLVENGHVNVVKGPRENRSRPAIDPLFRSAALAFGTRVVGIVLTGLLNDGTSGLIAIKEAGGVAIVQDPEEALYAEMPESAIAHVQVDHILPVAGMGQALETLVQQRLDERLTSNPSRRFSREVDIASGRNVEVDEGWGEPVSLSCPECGGPMRELTERSLKRLRCEIGHGFTEESFFDAKNDEVHQALSVAERTLKEKSSMLERMAREMRDKGRDHAAKAFQARADETRAETEVIRRVLYGKD